MREIAPGVWQLAGFPRDAINIYWVGGVLIDTGTRWAVRRIVREIGQRSVSLVLLTHAHPDHQGCARAACERWRAPLACHAADVDAMEGRAPMLHTPWVAWGGRHFVQGPPHRVNRVLQEGDEIAGFRIVHTPGHTPGHVSLLRASDRVVIAGDVIANMHAFTGATGLQEPPPFFSWDPALNRLSMRKLVDLNPSLVCFGHGPTLADLPRLHAFVDRRCGART